MFGIYPSRLDIFNRMCVGIPWKDRTRPTSRSKDEYKISSKQKKDSVGSPVGHTLSAQRRQRTTKKPFGLNCPDPDANISKATQQNQTGVLYHHTETTTMDITNNRTAPKVSGSPQDVMPVPPARQVSKCVSTGGVSVVETSGFPRAATSASADDDAVIAAPEPTNEERAADNTSGQVPAEIPPEETKVVVADEGEELAGADEDGEDDDESEYEYEDDDDAAFSGFLLSTAPATTSTATAAAPSAAAAAASSSASMPARIEEDTSVVAGAAEQQRKKWREPTREAVSMSLRAQQETSGSKRRLAQDLYRIMNQDTEEAGFSLAPQSEDSMENWTIKLFQFDEDSNLAKDMMVLGIDHIQLEMKFPDQYPFEPPFVRVVKPRFKRQTGFVMNGALCMELLTRDGWNPINDIESVIVSVRSLLVVGDGRLQAATDLSESRYQALLKAATGKQEADSSHKRPRLEGDKSATSVKPVPRDQVGTYSRTEAHAAYSHLSDYHKKKGWDTSGWWAKKG